MNSSEDESSLASVSLAARSASKSQPRLKPVPVAKPRISYKSKVGKRSFIFQITLAIWTVLVWGGVAAIFLVAAISSAQSQNSRLAGMTPAERAQYYEQSANERAYPNAAAAIAIFGVSSFLMGVFWAWMVVALPLFIAAVATMDTDKTEKAITGRTP